MKPIEEIVQTPEYKNHVFMSALANFADEPDNGPAIYFDSSRNEAIIYHLKRSRQLSDGPDEVRILGLPVYIAETLQLYKGKLYDTLQEIVQLYLKATIKCGFTEITDRAQILKAYDAKNYGEMWNNSDFLNAFQTDVSKVMRVLNPIQELVSTL